MAVTRHMVWVFDGKSLKQATELVLKAAVEENETQLVLCYGTLHNVEPTDSVSSIMARFFLYR